MTETHIDEGLLIGYCDVSVTAATAAAIEAHLMSCAGCRAGLAAVAVGVGAAGRREEPSAMWDAILEQVDRSARSVTERTLGAVGVRADVARLLATTPALRAAWLAAVTMVAAFAVAAASFDGGDPWPLLVIAPLLPLAGVATAFGPALDPTYEIAVAAPMSALRLALWRTLAVVATTLPVLLVATVAAPGAGWAPFGWVLPSFALISATLALSTWMPPERAGVVVGLGWLVAVVVLLDRDRAGDFVVRSLIFHLPGQSVAVVLAMAGVAMVAVRPRSFDQLMASRRAG